MKVCKKCKGLGRVLVIIPGVPFSGVKSHSVMAVCKCCYGKGRK